MVISVNDIRACIASIPDPEIPVITIKELGILRNIKWQEGRCEVSITPTYTACPAMPMIEQQIKERLNDIGVQEVDVKMVYSPAWSTDWLSDEAKEKMRAYGIAPPLHSSCSKLFDAKAQSISCPRCNSKQTDLISRFGSTACKAYYLCSSCKETFEHFICH